MSNRDISTIKHQGAPPGAWCMRKTRHHTSFSLLGNVVSDHNAVNDAAGNVVAEPPPLGCGAAAVPRRQGGPSRARVSQGDVACLRTAFPANYSKDVVQQQVSHCP